MCREAGARPGTSLATPNGSRREDAMPVTASVQEFLRRANVAYTVFPHPPAFTAQDEAAVTHVPGRDWAKSVVCFADGEPIQAVVPADRVIDLVRLSNLAGAESLRLADENELDWLYPDCERGAMPPFGPLYRQRVFVDESLTAEPEIVFNAGTHADAVCMRYDDFAALTWPIVGRFTERV
jgi:Ala-tRNA(Pro) deacylase